MNPRRLPFVLILLLLGAALLAACSAGGGREPVAEAAGHVEQPAAMMDDHADDHAMDDHAADDHADDHDEDDMEMSHDVPAEAAAMANPIPASAESIKAGAELFAASCTPCHGENGLGDGPAAAGLDPKPANLQEHHVQGLTDGALFYIISQGEAGTAMPAWENSLSAEARWQIINFLRTLK